MRILLKTTQAYRLLKEEKREGRLNHSYLLVFDDARNLSVALREFAKVFFLSFENEAESDAEKRICELINRDSFADCVVLPEAGKKFSTEDADKIAEECALKPVEGDKKLFLIGDFADATPQAQNKLLKLLEEPPEGVYFLLGTTSVFPVLPTVISRMEKLEIPPFPQKDCVDCLKRMYPNVESVSLYAAASDGSIGTAQNIIEGGYYDDLMEKAFALVEPALSRLPKAVKDVSDTGYKKALLGLLRIIFRDALIIKTTLCENLKNGYKPIERHLILKGQTERLKALADGYELAALLYAQGALAEAEKEFRFNGIFAQSLELCMVKIFAENSRRN